MTEPLLQPLSESQTKTIVPTDVARFVRLGQCERFLRFRLHERAHGTGFMGEYGVRAQRIPALFPRSGQEFEDRIEGEAAERGRTVSFRDAAKTGGWTDINAEIVQLARSLPAGESVLLFQPRVSADVDGWRIRGAIDLLRLARDDDGRLGVLIADMKATRATKVDHRLQVAFYHEMIATVFAEAGLDLAGIELGILYRGPSTPDTALSEAERRERDDQRALAMEIFGLSEGLLEVIRDPLPYLGSVRDLVTDERSTARRVAAMEFADVPFHIDRHCDSCIYNEFCMKWAFAHDDLSVLPHATINDKRALQQIGITTVADLAALKTPASPGSLDLVSTPGLEALAQRAATTWPIGPRVDELVLRARSYRSRMRHDGEKPPSFIPDKGYGSLPLSSPDLHPNLVRIYVDVQGDYLHDRVYMLGALIVGCEEGEERETRRRVVVRLAGGPPDTAAAERDLLIGWMSEVLATIVAVAAADEDGEPNAPIHLIFWDSLSQTLLLDALARHFQSVLDATALYDFMTQVAGYDSPLTTFLSEEIRQRRNYPFVCQSLQSVAAWLGFDWNTPEPYRKTFAGRMFDFWGRFDPEDDESWFMSRARFNSQIPLEYAYGAWHDLPSDAETSDIRRYAAITTDQLTGFERHRLEAIEHVARDLPTNRLTKKNAFALSDLSVTDGKARTLAGALHEFVTIERLVELAAWRAARNPAPEKRILSGETLLVRYFDADQDPGTRAINAENRRRATLRDEYFADAREAAEPGDKVKLSTEQNKATKPTIEGLRLRFRIDVDGAECGLDEALGMATLRADSLVVINPRIEIDRRPDAPVREYTPTAKSMLYAPRGELAELRVERDSEGIARRAWATVEFRQTNAWAAATGFVFGTIEDKQRGFGDGDLYMLDSDPNDWSGSHSMKLATALSDGSPNTLHERLDGRMPTTAYWPEAAKAGQRRFVDGLKALHTAGLLDDFEPSKLDYMGEHGDDPILVVQGPPGTGKSYTTAFAILARMQGAMDADIPFRVAVSCHTHAAINVLLGKLVETQEQLAELMAGHPAITRQYFRPELSSVPLYRLKPKEEPNSPILSLPPADQPKMGERTFWGHLERERYCVVGGTPLAHRSLVVSKHGTPRMFGNLLFQCLIIDEASQMNLPLAMLAALALAPDGQLIAVGDHRQMPPIVKHDWANERRRTFQEYRTYVSLFETLLEMGLPTIRFSRSFRLHSEMADFLRREIYAEDGIEFHSTETRTLPTQIGLDPFVEAVLAPDYPIVVIVHDEDRSQLRNVFEQNLIAPVLETLATVYGLDCRTGLGVVVPHRAQRAGLRDALPVLSEVDETGTITHSSVDTVERFQGDERLVIVYSATESDPQYLVTASKFLMDPRRLTVALSRARRKIIVVAARSVFGIFSSDEETFKNAQLWKNLLREECTALLWDGDAAGIGAQVWGSRHPDDNGRGGSKPDAD
ncbi:MAG TPA: AAA domain-containing protein [Thermomicrobiales bacterium]|nr:AAA domain-containing protein [Thermomicrobiales bacterium]